MVWPIQFEAMLAVAHSAKVGRKMKMGDYVIAFKIKQGEN
jgi:hypothetical protein